MSLIKEYNDMIFEGWDVVKVQYPKIWQALATHRRKGQEVAGLRIDNNTGRIRVDLVGDKIQTLTFDKGFKLINMKVNEAADDATGNKDDTKKAKKDPNEKTNTQYGTTSDKGKTRDVVYGTRRSDNIDEGYRIIHDWPGGSQRDIHSYVPKKGLDGAFTLGYFVMKWGGVIKDAVAIYKNKYGPLTQAELTAIESGYTDWEAFHWDPLKEMNINETISETCPACDGYGEVAKYGDWRDIQNIIDCTGCGGTGKVTPEKADEIRAFQRYGPDER